MKKIALVTPIYLPAELSGSANAILQLAQGLSERGLDCSIITSNALTTRWWYDPVFGKKISEKSEIINGVKIFRLACCQPLSFVALAGRCFKMFLPKSIFKKLEFLSSGPVLMGLFDLLKKEGFAAIYSSPLPCYLNQQVADAILRLSPPPKFIIHPAFHVFISHYHNPEFQNVFDVANLIHVKSKSEKEDIQKVFNIPDNKFAIIPFFLDLTSMKELAEIDKEVLNFRKKHNLENKKIVLSTSGKNHLKGATTLSQALNILSKKNPDILLVIIGDNSLNREKTKAETEIKNIINLGYVTDEEKEVIFAASDIFCLPSVAESFGISYLEAWKYKKPVIGADIPIVRELILGNRGGLLVKFGDGKELAETIEKLAQNPVLVKELGENGYQAIISKYNSSKLIPEFEKLF